MTYLERLEALDGDSYDYDEGVDGQPGFLDYDDPRDYEEWCDCNNVDVEEEYHNPFRLDVGERFNSPGTTFVMDTDIVVVASIVCDAQKVASQISELPGLYGDIESGPGMTFPEHEDRPDVPDLLTFIDDGHKGPSLTPGDILVPPVSFGVGRVGSTRSGNRR